MAVISITATGLGPELVAGIPQLVGLSTNIPALVFYTLDGSEPDSESPVYVSPIEMPGCSTRLRVLAVSGPDRGALDITFYVDALPEFLVSPRGGSAVYADAYDVVNAVEDGYGPDAHGVLDVVVRGTDDELIDYDFRQSPSDRFGNPPGLLISIGFPDAEAFSREKRLGVDFEPSSPNNQNVFFNPRSLYITIDARDGYGDQVQDGYRILNRTFMSTMDVTRYLGGKIMYEPHPYISGGFVRSFRNPATGVEVFYYFDHNETRWIKSIQRYDPSALPVGVGLQAPGGLPRVIPWIYNKRSMI